jgi:PAS domain S-box-containing protein
MPGLFYLFDREGNYIRWNKRKELITGYNHDEIAAMKPLDFFREDKHKIEKHVEDCFKHGETVVEADLVTKGGMVIPFYFTGLRVDYEGKECLLGMGIDISDRKQAEHLLRQSSERLRELSAHLQKVREEERIRISREIHDELGQQLTVLKMDISWLKRKVPAEDPRVEQKMNDLMKVIDHTVKTVRKISSDLRPSLLDDLGLVAALEWHSQEFEKRSGIQTSFVAAVPELEIEPAVATAMFRIFQETLTNVARHADATRIEATLAEDNEKLVMRIRDNGRGFSKSEIGNKRTLGILGMQERAAIMEGEYSIDSSPGEGTIVEVKVPIGNHEKEKSLL